MAENNPYAAPTAAVETPAPVAAPNVTRRRLDWSQRIGLIIITVGQIAAVGGTTGFLSFAELPFPTAVIVAALTGVVGTAVLSPSYGLRRSMGGACGIAIGIGAFLLADWWLTGRNETSNYEMVLVEAIGAIPGILLFVLLRKKFGPNENAR